MTTAVGKDLTEWKCDTHYATRYTDGQAAISAAVAAAEEQLAMSPLTEPSTSSTSCTRPPTLPKHGTARPHENEGQRKKKKKKLSEKEVFHYFKKKKKRLPRFQLHMIPLSFHCRFPLFSSPNKNRTLVSLASVPVLVLGFAFRVGGGGGVGGGCLLS